MSSVMGFVISCVIGLLVGRWLVPVLHRAKFGQEVREEGPQSHLKKQGTPTMGGILFFVTVPLTVLLTLGFRAEGLFLVGAAVLFGLIGLLDDGLKIFMHQSLGLRAWQKIALQLVVTIILLVWGIYGVGLVPAFWVPIFNGVWTNPIFYVVVMFFVIVGTTNSANLTDGLDGLLSTLTAVISVAYMIIAHRLLDEASMVFAAVLLGTMVAFLVYNRHPAKVFMGDTGSFFIGGAVVALAMITKTELLLPLLALVYMAESISVMLQVVVFKKTGRRVFRMAPLHHHFEMGGLKEVQVVRLFMLVSILTALLSILLLYGSAPSVIMTLKG